MNAANSHLPPDAIYTRTCDHFNVGTCTWKPDFCHYPHVCCLCGDKTHGYNRCPHRQTTVTPGLHPGGVSTVPGQDENHLIIPPTDNRSLPYQRPVYCPKEHCNTREDFGSYQALQRHLNSVHLNNDLFWCHVCGETGPVTLGGIQYHVKACHSNANPQELMLKIEENLRARGGINYWYWIPEVGGPTTKSTVGVEDTPSTCIE